MGLFMNSAHRGSATLVLIVMTISVATTVELSADVLEELDAQMKLRCPPCYNADTVLDKYNCEVDNECAKAYNCKLFDCGGSESGMDICYDKFSEMLVNFACDNGDSGTFAKWD